MRHWGRRLELHDLQLRDREEDETVRTRLFQKRTITRTQKESERDQRVRGAEKTTISLLKEREGFVWMAFMAAASLAARRCHFSIMNIRLLALDVDLITETALLPFLSRFLSVPFCRAP